MARWLFATLAGLVLCVCSGCGPAATSVSTALRQSLNKGDGTTPPILDASRRVRLPSPALNAPDSPFRSGPDKKAVLRAALQPDAALLQSLPPLDSGPGIAVCEPTVQKSALRLANFGAGCGRWLHLHVGGQGEFGKTPLWGSMDDARRDMNRPDLRFAKADALQLAQKLGATHVAT